MLGSAVAFAKGGGGIVQSGTKSGDLLLLRLDLPLQHLIFGSQGIDALLILPKLRGYELHFRP